eukprot:2193928-Prorocentrum_lima.AAC.1
MTGNFALPAVDFPGLVASRNSDTSGTHTRPAAVHHLHDLIVAPTTKHAASSLKLERQSSVGPAAHAL